MIIPKIKLLKKVSAATTVDDKVLYTLRVFVDSIRAYNTDTQSYVGDYTGIPLELFLYQKYDNTTVGAELKEESVGSGFYVRTITTNDLDEENPMLLGVEKKTWAVLESPRHSNHGTLQKAIPKGGVELSLATVNRAIAPLQTFNRSGFYKSRVFVFHDTDANRIEMMFKSVQDNLLTFLRKHIDNMVKLQGTQTLQIFETISIK